MKEKKIILNLIDFRPFEFWATFQGRDALILVESVKNTVKYVSGTWLTTDKVEDVCDKSWYDVNIRMAKQKDIAGIDHIPLPPK